MQQVQLLMDIEQGFAKVLRALTPREFEFNRRLLNKTRKVASLLARVTELRKEIENKLDPEGQVTSGKIETNIA